MTICLRNLAETSLRGRENVPGWAWSEAETGKEINELNHSAFSTLSSNDSLTRLQQLGRLSESEFPKLLLTPWVSYCWLLSEAKVTRWFIKPMIQDTPFVLQTQLPFLLPPCSLPLRENEKLILWKSISCRFKGFFFQTFGQIGFQLSKIPFTKTEWLAWEKSAAVLPSFLGKQISRDVCEAVPELGGCPRKPAAGFRAAGLKSTVSITRGQRNSLVLGGCRRKRFLRRDSWISYEFSV